MTNWKKHKRRRLAGKRTARPFGFALAGVAAAWDVSGVFADGAAIGRGAVSGMGQVPLAVSAFLGEGYEYIVYFIGV